MYSVKNEYDREQLSKSYEREGFAFIQNCFSPDLIQYLKESMKLAIDEGEGIIEKLDCIAVERYRSQACYKSRISQALFPLLTPLFSSIVNKPLAPAYSMFRKYEQGNDLALHVDRPACQYSLTCIVDSAEDKLWPFYLKTLSGKEVAIENQNPGDLIMYQGEKVFHSRNRLPHEWSSHVFLHWVDSSDPVYRPHMFDRHRAAEVQCANEESSCP